MGFLVRAIITIIINAIALIIVAELLQTFYIEDFKTALLASLIITVFNLTIRPILIFMTLPAVVLTLGLSLILINAFILMLADLIISDTFIINGFGAALIASIIISLITMVLNKFVKRVV